MLHKLIQLVILFFQIYSKAPATSYNPYYSSQNDKYSSYKSPSYSSYQPTYQQYQPLAYTPTQPAQFSYAQPSNNYAAYSSVVYGPQSIAQQIPYAYSPIQPINPVLHAAPIASFANSYQTPTNAFYVNPQQIHKVPFYNQQPQAFNVASYPSTNYHVKQFSQSSPHSQIITSKPVALDSPIAQSPSLSHIEHNNGAVSYTHFSHLGERKPSAAPLIASQSPQQVYYHQQPQPIYNADYSKQAQYAAVPIASNYYPAQVGVHYGNVPYAHISKVPIAPQTSASTLISSVAPLQQKVVFPR